MLIPSGMYLTGPIGLKSGVELHVEAGATVLFSRDYNDYPLVQTYFEGDPRVRCTAPIHGRELRDVAITGEGVFDGQGQAWRPVKKFKMTRPAVGRAAGQRRGDRRQGADLVADGKG